MKINCAYLVLGGVVLLTIWVMLPHGQTGCFPTTRRSQCQNDLKNITLALYNYATAHDGNWPPAVINDEDGNPMHSWRVLVLPYLDAQDIYDRYDFTERWDGPNNRKLADAMPSTYACDTAKRESHQTSYMVISAAGGVFNRNSTTNIEDIFDGAGQTLLLAEYQNRSVNWMSPQDSTGDQFVEDLHWSASGAAVHPGGLNVSFSDGRVKFLSAETEEKTVRAMMTINGGDALADEDY